MAKILPPQSRIGSYVIERQIGVGGMGAVYSARSPDGAEVALKLLHADAATEEDSRKRFLREAKATMALNHDNVVKMVETFEHEGQPVIAMELLRGAPLSRHIEGRGKLPVAEMARIFLRVVSAVGSAHALGLVHRDLKPDNVLVLDASPWVKVLDFGIAKIRKGYSLEESSALTRTGMLVGTPYYMSPEQAFGDKSIDHRADLWSLGLMLYEALTGTLLTRAPTLHEVFTKLLSGPFPRLDQVDPSIPADIADLVHRMLSRERADRPVDLREVFVVLSAYTNAVEDEPTSFNAAVAPISFGSDSVPSQAPQAASPTGAGTELLPASASPVHLTPRSISSDTGRRTPEGTVVIDREADGIAPPPAAPTPASGYLDATVHLPKKSGVWMWLVAALIVAGCVVVLVRELL